MVKEKRERERKLRGLCTYLALLLLVSLLPLITLERAMLEDLFDWCTSKYQSYTESTLFNLVIRMVN